MFSDLFSYLNQNSTQENITEVHARDRPILISSGLTDPLLIPHSEGIYEIGFPYLNPVEFEQHDYHLYYQLSEDWKVYDEVLDESSIEDEEKLKQYREEYQNNIINTTVSLYLKNFNGLFETLYKNSQKGVVYLTGLVQSMGEFNIADANLPLVVKLEKDYNLTHKLRSRTNKLNSYLRRKNELMPISQIQELDNYSLRDYIRRPGSSPEEKAGSKQQLMGVKRYQEYNKLENQFLVYFATKILYLECFRYKKDGGIEHSDIVNKLRQVIETFKQDPAVKSVLIRGFKLTRPNYPLQHTYDYRSFYEAYQDYINKRTEKKRVWGYRNRLFGEVVYLCLVTALLRFGGLFVLADTNINIRNSPEMGGYLTTSGVNLQIFLRDTVYDLYLERGEGLEEGDYILIVEKHDLKSKNFKVQQIKLSIWVFWYRPSESTLEQARIYLTQQQGKVIYLERSSQEIDDPPWLYPFPQPSPENNFLQIAEILAEQIIIPLLQNDDLYRTVN